MAWAVAVLEISDHEPLMDAIAAAAIAPRGITVWQPFLDLVDVFGSDRDLKGLARKQAERCASIGFEVEVPRVGRGLCDVGDLCAGSGAAFQLRLHSPTCDLAATPLQSA